MSVKKIIRKIIPYRLRVTLNPLRKALLSSGFRQRSLYVKTRTKEEIQPHMIFYEAYHGESMTGNPYAVFKYLLHHPDFEHFTHVWAIEHESVVPSSIKSHPRVMIVKYKSKQYIKYLATCKYLINNTTFPFYFHKRKDQVYANIWHGTPLKTMGMDIKNRGLTDHKNIQRNFLFADYFVSPNKFTYQKLLKSHDIYSIYNGEILDIGYPRVDLMYKANKTEMRQKLGISSDKKLILYAPTWRVQQEGDEDEQCQIILSDIETMVQNLNDEYIILIKSHYYVHDMFEKHGRGNLCVPNSIDTNELLAITDILITDYSSIFFDFLPTKKPIIFYAYDKDDYLKERGTYIPMDELPGPLCLTINQVIENIRNINTVHLNFKDTYHHFLTQYCYHDDGQATDRFVDVFFNGKSSVHGIKIKNDKQKILIYGGGFRNNGITAALINLLNAIDYNRYDVTLVDHASNTKASKWNNMQKINKPVHHIFRFGQWNASLIDLYRHTLFLSTGKRKIAPDCLYKAELSRITGLTEFDIGIDFSGYSPFWAALFAFGDFKRKTIYLHSDMGQEVMKKINNTFPHRRNLKVIFSLYNLFDKVISVSEFTHKRNKSSLKHMIKNHREKMDYVINTINYNHILSLKDKGELQYEFGEEISPDTDSQQRFEQTYPMPDQGNTNFITIGRLSPEKDHEKLIHSFSQIVKTHPHAKLYIVGEGVLENHLMKLVQDCQLEDNVIFTGQVNNPYTLLDQCDCFILSSNYEGQPVVLLEALVLNKPIIVTDVPGSRSVIGEDYGLVVDNSVAGLAHGMQQYLAGKTLNKKTFDYEQYQSHAIQMFYDKVCRLEN